MKNIKTLFVLTIFFVIANYAVCAPTSASSKHKLIKSKNDKKFTELRLKNETQQELKSSQEQANTQEEIYTYMDMRFGKIVRIQDNIAVVQIISKIPPSEIPPKFLACDYRLNPVAELESINTGYKDCFMFKIIEGNAMIGDNVIVRYYKTKTQQ